MGYKLFLKNPYLRQAHAKIIHKKYENNLYHLTLDRTIFFPSIPGVHPRDTGTINGIKVQDIYEENSEIIHVINEDIYNDRVNLSIDWGNRVDNMQQHTGQHLLSAGFDNLFNVDTTNFHICEKFAYIDINIPSINTEQIEKIETYINKIITSNFEISDFNFSQSRCEGLYLRNTGEVGIIKIKNYKKHKKNTRINFVCGNRALKDYGWKNQYINELAKLLSIKDKDVLDEVKSLITQKKELESEIKKLKP